MSTERRREVLFPDSTVEGDRIFVLFPDLTEEGAAVEREGGPERVGAVVEGQGQRASAIFLDLTEEGAAVEGEEQRTSVLFPDLHHFGIQILRIGFHQDFSSRHHASFPSRIARNGCFW